MRLPADWQAPATRRGVAWRRSSASALAAEPEVTFEWVGNALRHAGVLVHRFIQRIARDGLSQWPYQRVAECKPEIAGALASMGVPPAELAAAASRVRDALTGTLEDPTGRWTLEAHREAQSELALSAVLESRTVHVVIDRTFIDADGTRWIVDYKTSAHEGAGLDAFLDNEVERYRGQLALYELVLRLQDPAHPIRTGLYFPLLRAWRVVVT